MTVRAVCFDVGSTLLTPIRPEYETIADILNDYGHHYTYDEVHRQIDPMYHHYEEIYERDKSVWADNVRARAMWMEVYRSLCESLDLHTDVAEIAEKLYLKYFTPEAWHCFDDVSPTISGLHLRGIKCGIISNWDSSLTGILGYLGMSPLFQTIISSADVGLYKPDAEIFSLATGRLAVSPDEAWHVGDHADADVRGARQAGLTGVLLARQSNQESAYRAGAVLAADETSFVISDLRELLSLVDKANGETNQ
jgi:REG-2-like HAD superfamily hydrolase